MVLHSVKTVVHQLINTRMDTINGLLQYTLQNIGSKSEGYIATLICDDSIEYILYRENYLPIDDSFFEPFNNKNVSINSSYVFRYCNSVVNIHVYAI